MTNKVTKSVMEILEKNSKEREKKSEMFSKDVRDAMDMADKFSSIEPEPYILPLDALAGFPVASTIKTDKNA